MQILWCIIKMLPSSQGFLGKGKRFGGGGGGGIVILSKFIPKSTVNCQ